MKPTYVTFYIEGREDRLLKHDIDTDEIARLVMNGKGSIYELLLKASKAAAEPLLVARKKRTWIEEFEAEIKTAGGDAEEAYRHYIDGRVDELAFSLERDAVEALAEACGSGTSGDGVDDEDEDDEDEESEEE
jgi:DNA polymerase III delta subunit